MRDTAAEITYNQKISSSYYLLGLSTGWSSFHPGQFVMVCIPDKAVFLRRPFSIAQSIEDGAIEICYKVVGTGTERLSKMAAGESLQVLGPLGNGFTVSRSVKNALIVAGGFGIAPFVAMCRILARKNIGTTLFYGGRGMEDILYLDHFEGHGVRCHISTEDGSLGHKGVITELLSTYLESLPPFEKGGTHDSPPLKKGGNPPFPPLKKGGNPPFPPLKKGGQGGIYCCGPKGLIEAVARLANERGIPAQISHETYMACGFGVCLGCAVATKDGYVRACTEGPVFDLKDLIKPNPKSKYLMSKQIQIPNPNVKTSRL